MKIDAPPPCAQWFSAYARDWHTKHAFHHSWVQMMCDMMACMKLIEHHEVSQQRPEQAGRGLQAGD